MTAHTMFTFGISVHLDMVLFNVYIMMMMMFVICYYLKLIFSGLLSMTKNAFTAPGG